MTDSNIQLTNEENTATPYRDDERHGDSMNNDFVKPDEQSSCLLESSAMARKRTFKNVLVKPNEQRPSLLGLCHGEKTKAKPADMVISDSA